MSPLLVQKLDPHPFHRVFTADFEQKPESDDGKGGPLSPPPLWLDSLAPIHNDYSSLRRLVWILPESAVKIHASEGAGSRWGSSGRKPPAICFWWNAPAIDNSMGCTPV